MPKQETPQDDHSPSNLHEKTATPIKKLKPEQLGYLAGVLEYGSAPDSTKPLLRAKPSRIEKLIDIYGGWAVAEHSKKQNKPVWDWYMKPKARAALYRAIAPHSCFFESRFITAANSLELM
jgi:hypothetical protein